MAKDEVNELTEEAGETAKIVVEEGGKESIFIRLDRSKLSRPIRT
jgi:hypothetical protein